MIVTHGSGRAGSGNFYPMRNHITATFANRETEKERQEDTMTNQCELAEWLQRAYPDAAQVNSSEMTIGQIGIWRPESRDASEIQLFEIRNGMPYCLTDGKYKAVDETGVYDLTEGADDGQIGNQ